MLAYILFINLYLKETCLASSMKLVQSHQKFSKQLLYVLNSIFQLFLATSQMKRPLHFYFYAIKTINWLFRVQIDLIALFVHPFQLFHFIERSNSLFSNERLSKLIYFTFYLSNLIELTNVCLIIATVMVRVLI